MSNPVYTNVPAETVADPIAELALNLSWTWNHSTDELWRELDPELWEHTENPWLILQAVSHDKLQQLLSDEAFRARVDEQLEKKRELEASDTWFQRTHPDSPLKAVAFFSMEYMLSEALPIYSGGLGNVAGDQLKAASDLGVPVIGIGLLYQQGYFRQEIDSTGAQLALYPFNDPGQLPVRPLRNQNGDWLRLKVLLPGYALWIRTWEAQVGRRKLYLLDTNDPANLPSYRGLTAELYGGGPEVRLRQEAVLGIAGWRLLRTLGIQPEVCHLNEGHAAFAVLERARAFMEEHNQPFDVALAATRAGNLFTTHTPVEAGFDRFSPELMKKYFKWYAEQRLKISLRDLLALGRRNPDDDSEPFNMAYLAIRGSGAVNGVSRLHGEVSRRLFQGLFPRWPEAEVPVGYVTNGIHVPTWDLAEADSLWTRRCGKRRWRDSLEQVEEQIHSADDEDLWRLRSTARKSLVQFTRQRVALQRAYQGAPRQEIEEASAIFDERRLTLGFARRFATYKRPDMLLHDPERLIRILTNPERPAQLIIAGKAHPQDWGGQAMIKKWNEFMRRSEVRDHAVFLADYDMRLTQELVAGVDVWINTPRRPMEASGTSGMKVLANGGLNLSELDGWWAEAYSAEVGWAIGDGKDRGDDPAWDVVEADALYDLLEREVIPEFYTRDESGIPTAWVKRMRESMARLTPQFSANRTVREYTEQYYLPAATAYHLRSANQGAISRQMVDWQHSLEQKWATLHFGEVKVETRGEQHVFEVQVCLNDLDPNEVRLELYADGVMDRDPVQQEMKRVRQLAGVPGIYVYSATVSAARPLTDYTARVIPQCDGVVIPLEDARILWQG